MRSTFCTVYIKLIFTAYLTCTNAQVIQKATFINVFDVFEICEPNTCGINADCRVRGGVHVCTCPNGYQGDPLFNCKIVVSDHTPCQPNPCGVNADCHVRGKALVCTWPNGYQGDPHFNCRTVVSDHTPCQPNPCGVNADCHVRGKAPVCTCPNGYQGDPHFNCTTGIGSSIRPTASHVKSCQEYQVCVARTDCDPNGIVNKGMGNLNLHNTLLNCYIDDAVNTVGVCCNQSPLIASYNCGHRNKGEVLDTRIQSTNEAQFGEFPWTAIIFVSNYTFVCGASLLNDKWLLTGGHCVNGLQQREIHIRLGEWQINSFDEPLAYVDAKVKGITVHPDFNLKSAINDIAVLELAKPVILEYHINNICLPASGQTFPNQRCIMSVWGKDSFEGFYQHILKKVDLPTIDKKQCQNLLRKTRLGKLFVLDNSFMCAGGEENKDNWKGYGGGGLVCEDSGSGQYYLAGITSWGIGYGVPGVYVDVQGFSTWIQEVISDTHYYGLLN